MLSNHNGILYPQDSGFIKGNNRAFMYGDGLFESIRIRNGKPMFLEAHIARLLDAAEALKMEVPKEYNLEHFRKQVGELIEKNEIKKGGKCRLTLFRNTGGTYTPDDNGAGYVIEAHQYATNEYTLNEEGFSIELYPEMRKPVNKLAIYKTCNSLLYIMAGIYARANKYDDTLIVNDKGNIIESSNSNLFIICNGVLYTPALSDGCLAGVMRMQIINIALANKLKVYECSLNPQNLLVADEVFLSNAVRGLQWVASYKMKRYYNKLTKELVAKLNEVTNG
ncbi:MAG TPA: aminotransferase class IV [Flavobacteriales bacterium]|nr:aminotransferase class IV [Flavobacteriales bacterium]